MSVLVFSNEVFVNGASFHRKWIVNRSLYPTVLPVVIFGNDASMKDLV